MITTEFDDFIADRLQAEHHGLAARWFQRLVDLLPVEARAVFPTDSLLDHVPALIHEIGQYLRDPREQAIAGNTAILDKARELGALRHGQKASLHQVLREYQMLYDVLIAFVVEEMATFSTVMTPTDAVRLVSRLHQAVGVLSQSTVETFVTLYIQTITEQSERLEQFTRMAAHEWRQPLGALHFGLSVLRRPDIDAERTARVLDTLERNVTHMVTLTHKLEAVARMHPDVDNALVQQVSTATIAFEAARQLREMADARDVTIEIDETLPELTVDVGRLELVFVNLLSNAIKYADPAKPSRTIAITSEVDGLGNCRLHVRDNGIGIPAAALGTIFQRFTRAHADHASSGDIDGMGLGLSIVEDCAKAMGGRIEVDSTEGEGSTFSLVLPVERS